MWFNRIKHTIYGVCGCKMGKPIEPPVFKESYYYVIWGLKIRWHTCKILSFHPTSLPEKHSSEAMINLALGAFLFPFARIILISQILHLTKNAK